MKDDQIEKIAALEERIAAVEGFVALQQRAQEKARVLLDKHQRIFEGLTGQSADPGKASSN